MSSSFAARRSSSLNSQPQRVEDPARTSPKYPRPEVDQNYGVILGCPRSGTTYISRLLSTVPEFETVVGTILPTAIPHVVRQNLSPDVYWALAIGFERALDAYLHSGRFRSRARALQKWVRAPNGIRGLIRAIRGEHPLPKSLIYKEPFLALSPKFVVDALPNCKILHICRDGRDCANSLVKSYDVLTDARLRHLGGTEMRVGRRYDDRFVPWWVDEEDEDQFMQSTPYVRAIYMWRYMVQSCHTAFHTDQILDTGRIMELRYEDLVRDPMTHGPAVVEFFDGSPSGRLQKLLKNAHTDSIGSYQHRDPEEIAEAERVAGDELELYGYLST